MAPGALSYVFQPRWHHRYIDTTQSSGTNKVPASRGATQERRGSREISHVRTRRSAWRLPPRPVSGLAAPRRLDLSNSLHYIVGMSGDLHAG